MPLTQKQLVKNTPKVVKDRSKICVIRPKQQGKYVKDKKLGNVFEIQYTVKCLDGDRTVTLRYVGKAKPGLSKSKRSSGIPAKDSELWVSCDCPYHLFYVEYALAKYKSSDIIYSNGKRPKIKNPKEIAFTCKHVNLAMETAIKDYKQLGDLQNVLKKLWRSEPVETKIRTPKKQVIPDAVMQRIVKDLSKAEKTNDLGALTRVQKSINDIVSVPAFKDLKTRVDKIKQVMPKVKVPKGIIPSETLQRFKKIYDTVNEYRKEELEEEKLDKKKTKKQTKKVSPGIDRSKILERFRKVKDIPEDFEE